MKNNRAPKSILFISLLSALLFSCGDVESESKSLTLKGIKEGEIVEIQPKEELRYIQAMHEQEKSIPEDKRYSLNDLGGDKVKIASYCEKATACKGVKVELSFEHKGFGEGRLYKYHLSTKEDFSDEVVYLSKSDTFFVTSLESNAKYYWKVSDVEGKVVSNVKSFKTTYGWRGIDAGLTNNVRDLGGKKVKGNKIIKQGLIYRGCELNIAPYEGNGNHERTINDETIRVFKDVMKVGTEIDLRGVAESGGLTSSNLGWSVKYDRQSIGAYGGLLTDNSGKEDKRVKAIFKDCLEATRDSSVYFHCWGGADRTGTIAFLLGGLLGMSYTDLIIDYELTSFSYNLREHDKLGEHSNFPSLIEGLKSVSKQTGENRDIQTMIEYYLVNKVGINSDEINQFKNLMLEDYHE
ncbi:MAG: tyrosine-protein phosphatase [Bacilli bacterium]|nr:tyrosine-protein phosphatase [Bacilli bacterium]